MKTKAEGELRVLGTEIKLDASRKGVHKSKYERLAELQNKASDLTAKIGESLSKVYEEIKDINENQVTEAVSSKTAKSHDLEKELKDKDKRDTAEKTEDKDDNTNSDVN